jgi:3-oxoacyl-[acyl-carrier-protein] synthase-1
MLQARRMLLEGLSSKIIVAGVDSFLVAATLAELDRQFRLLTRSNPNGLIPGEAASAVLLTAPQEESTAPLLVRGLGFGREPAHPGSGQGLRAEGLVQAARGALSEAGIALKDCDARIADMNGEQYRFKEAALLLSRSLRDRKPLFPLWHLGDSVGEIGSATVPAMLTVLFDGARKDYLPGSVFLGHVGNDDDKRASFVAEATLAQTLSLELLAEAEFRDRRRSAP